MKRKHISGGSYIQWRLSVGTVSALALLCLGSASAHASGKTPVAVNNDFRQQLEGMSDSDVRRLLKQLTKPAPAAGYEAEAKAATPPLAQKVGADKPVTVTSDDVPVRMLAPIAVDSERKTAARPAMPDASEDALFAVPEVNPDMLEQVDDPFAKISQPAKAKRVTAKAAVDVVEIPRVDDPIARVAPPKVRAEAAQKPRRVAVPAKVAPAQKPRAVAASVPSKAVSTVSARASNKEEDVQKLSALAPSAEGEKRIRLQDFTSEHKVRHTRLTPLQDTGGNAQGEESAEQPANPIVEKRISLSKPNVKKVEVHSTPKLTVVRQQPRNIRKPVENVEVTDAGIPIPREKPFTRKVARIEYPKAKRFPALDMNAHPVEPVESRLINAVNDDGQLNSMREFAEADIGTRTDVRPDTPHSTNKAKQKRVHLSSEDSPMLVPVPRAKYTDSQSAGQPIVVSENDGGSIEIADNGENAKRYSLKDKKPSSRGWQNGTLVDQALFTTLVKDKAPASPVSKLAADSGKVNFFTALRDQKGKKVIHRWSLDGTHMFDIPFTINENYWRVWSEVELSEDYRGTMSVQVVSEDGQEIARKTLEVY